MRDNDDDSKAIDKLCIWYKSKSIPKTNPSYKDCRETCNGFNTKCIIYTPRKEYFQNIGRGNVVWRGFDKIDELFKDQEGKKDD